MDGALTTLARRSAGVWLIAAAVGLGLVLTVVALRTALRPTALWTGLLLYGLVVALALFNLRKKLPFLPLARASTWMEIHLAGGCLSLLVYFLHAGGGWPTGTLEQTVATAFLLAALSGLFGWYLSRKLPPLLTRSGEPLTYERIPEYRQEIRGRIEEIVQAAEQKNESTTFGDFYLTRLSAYLDRRPAIFAPLLRGGRAHAEIMARLAALGRYLHPDERAPAQELAEWIEAKRNLEIQFAGQRLLRLWLFVHIPATYGLLLLGAVHGWIAYAYSQGF